MGMVKWLGEGFFFSWGKMWVYLAELVCAGWGIRIHPNRIWKTQELEGESERAGGECKTGDVWAVERQEAMAGLGRLLGKQAGIAELGMGTRPSSRWQEAQGDRGRISAGSVVTAREYIHVLEKAAAASKPLEPLLAAATCVPVLTLKPDWWQ